eukprot:TRINITY_DN1761_c0_g2_i1.p1 TRINITY_DN1761_c0_g2~~TRINITY_DN1761_c0_g2_i1.p1  ORF type:complete len:452 (-),score=160.48 TRINITY_DN1761_c0_g2_i1:21-1376(-)
MGVIYAVGLIAIVCFCNAQDTPPMGFNTYDSFEEVINETQYRQQVGVLASIKQHGWQYGVIDAGWYENLVKNDGSVFSDGYSRLIPDPVRFPSSKGANGFQPLASWVHSNGLRMGVHVMRGIHKQVVEANEPIFGTSYHAQDIAVASDACDWWGEWYGVNMSHPGGQAYYDSIVQLYASWTLDFIKVDCIFGGRDGHPADIRAVSQAIQGTNAVITLSLSPGLGATPAMAAELSPYVNTYRITNDLWDCFDNTSTNAPCPYDHVTVAGALDVMPQFQDFIGAQGLMGLSWPDADMLPIGVLLPPGQSVPQPTGLTQDEQRLLSPLWCIFRNPLMFGGDLTKLDNFTLGLITNDDVLGVHQASSGNRQFDAAGGVYAWRATSTAAAGGEYVAVFNVNPTVQTYDIQFSKLGLGLTCTIYDCWAQSQVGVYKGDFVSTIPVHGANLYLLQDCS